LEQEEKEGDFDTIRYLLQDRGRDILGKPPEETQSATFYKIEDAIFWENHLKKDTAHSSIETKPIFSS
jgi:hypothetical protein